MQPTLETERLLLRPLMPQDAPALQRLAGRREIADTTISIPHPYSEAQAREWIAGTAGLFAQGKAVVAACEGIAAADHSFTRSLRRFVKPHVLLIDEFGYEPFDSAATKSLFRLVSARHGQGSIVLTANTGFTQWRNLFPSEAEAVATVDRLVDHATILRFPGKSVRTPAQISGAPLED